MTTVFQNMHSQIIAAMGIEDLRLPMVGARFFTHYQDIPGYVMEHHPSEITLTGCQALKQALLGDAVCLSIKNSGCVAGAISLGLVDKYQKEPIGDAIVYTDVMREQSGLGDQFIPPSPKDFTDGVVYACKGEDRLDFCLFGKEDSGRYRDRYIARQAIADMTAIQPATMKAVFLYPPHFEGSELPPDLVLLSLRPVELTRFIQAYQYHTGKRVTGTMGAVRVVCSDLMARPYITQSMNVSSFCLGARLIARFEADRLGLGMPFSVFQQMVKGMVDSKTGYPFHLYPGASG